MFQAIQDVPMSLILSGIIWAVVLGFAVGNYACSLVHRLPRGRLLLDKTPYCGSCGTLLKVKDLFPVISALMLRHRCRYCGAPFPTTHTWTELSVGLLFVLAFFEYSFTEQFLLVVTLGTFLITLAAIEANEKMIMGKVLLCVLVFGVMFRLLQDGTIYGFFSGGFFGLLVGAVIKRKDIKPVGHIYHLPMLAKLLAVGGACVGAHLLPLFLLLFLVLYALGRLIKYPATTAFALAVLLPVLYSH